MRTQKKIAYGKKYYQENKDVISARSRIRYYKFKEEINQRSRVNHINRDTRGLILERARIRARRKGIQFNLDIDDVVLPEYCPILGLKLCRNIGSPTAKPDSYSLDRIIPELGYTKGNVQVISYKANVMKNNATSEELRMFAEWVLRQQRSISNGKSRTNRTS